MWDMSRNGLGYNGRNWGTEDELYRVFEENHEN